ncbi:hypothetical protein PGQ11_010983 [Apiospora arundinis]|uniref:Uncharacterized protein n=1 Tax=Apiospora arundinis TaxID=335852 RepID=A0ABR2HY77_9PEZI
MEKGSGYHDTDERDDVQLKHCVQPTKGKGSGKAKRKYPDERAIAEIEWIHSNYEKMANKWVEAKKENLVLQRKIADLEAQKPSSPVLRQPKTTRPTTRSKSLVRGTQRRKTNLKIKVCQRLRRISRSAPSSADTILSSIESDSSWDAGSRNTELSDSGSDGYQGDCEAVPKRSSLRLGSVPRKNNRTSRALSPRILASLSRARARRRSSHEARRQRKKEQRPTRQQPSRSPPRYYRNSSSPDLSDSPVSTSPYPRGPRTPSPLSRRPPSPHSSVERLPAEIAREILPRMFIPSRDGLAALREALSIAQHVFHDAAREAWPCWTRDTFPQGAHEVSFSLLDIEGYFAGYSIRDGDFVLRGAASQKVFHAVRDVSWLRNRTCHFPPRSDKGYYYYPGNAPFGTTTLSAVAAAGKGGDVRAALMEGFSWPFDPDCAGWYWEAMSSAWRVARLLGDREALEALERLNDRVEDCAWAMLQRLEEIAAVRGLGDGSWDEAMEARGEVVRATMRAIPEELCVPLDMFFKTVRQSDDSWPLMIREAARVWEWTNAE